MDFIRKIMPVLWQIIEKNKKCSVNINSYEDKLTINILCGKRKKTFIHTDDRKLVSEIQNYLAA